MNIRRVIAVVVGLLAATFVVAGLWAWLAPAVNLVVERHGEVQFATELDPAKMFDGVAVFAFLTMGLGALIAVAAWFGLRSSRGLGGLFFVVLMSIATSAIALDLAGRFGRMVNGDVDAAVPGTYRGTTNLWMANDLGPSWVLLLCAPTVALFVYLACALLSSHADLGRGDDQSAQPSVQVLAEAGTEDRGVAAVTSGDAEPQTRL
ncbi:DUF2567 domain-containing protein [Gordonia sp. (in: high G+C Gram-positive bacteria)]|uniref:DUF2567 domain-containing protein n=1 Tax=Gordonia sp. (in: high G+C Gram-positive bacteria) TaxID=84139 RepID=UPI003C758378